MTPKVTCVCRNIAAFCPHPMFFPGVKAVSASRLAISGLEGFPEWGDQGLWYLCSRVDAYWLPNSAVYSTHSVYIVTLLFVTAYKIKREIVNLFRSYYKYSFLCFPTSFSSLQLPILCIKLALTGDYMHDMRQKR